MLKFMDRDEEENTEESLESLGDNLYEYTNERGVKRKVYYEDDDVFILGAAPAGGGYHDDLDELDGILPDLDRNLEDCEIALERLYKEHERALAEGHLALYLALETKVAQLKGYVQGLSFVRERLGSGAPTLDLLNEGEAPLTLGDSREAQARLDLLVKRIEGLLARRAEQGSTN
jgi:hypothetical protein